MVKMQQFIFFVLSGLVLLLFVGCVEQSGQIGEIFSDTGSVEGKKIAGEKIEEKKEVVGSTPRNYQLEAERPAFIEIKKEIDYWSVKGPGQIGREHEQKLVERLHALSAIPAGEIELYKKKLDEIVLVEEFEQQGGKIDSTSAHISESGKSGKSGNKIVGNCEGEGKVKFTHSPMAISEIEMIQPIGLMIGGHVTPIDHGYYSGKKWTSYSERKVEEFVDVFAPAAGIVEVQTMPEVYASSAVGDYRLVIHHTCTFYTIYIHVNQISEKLQKVVGGKGFVKVEAGEIIGRAPGFDFSVHDEEVMLPGFVVPASYDAEPFKLHTVDMFDSFVEPLRTQLLARNVRQAVPRGGKIDYDIDGKLVGNWFEEGTNAYFGKEEFQRMPGYWQTHLAFAYDGLVPGQVVASLGDYEGEARQFGVRGNGPDPAKVGMNEGVVKYELVSYDYVTKEGGSWNRVRFAEVTDTKEMNEVLGTVVVQMVESRKIKFEVFPGKRASEVAGFSGKEKVYVRGDGKNVGSGTIKQVVPLKVKSPSTTMGTKIDGKPVLYNLGITIDSWDKNTNRAGDIVFDRQNYVDNKIFTEFGHRVVNQMGEKLLPEIGFYVPVGTVVVSPINGVVTDVKLYEPSQDYILFLKTDTSEWIVGFEHVYNVKVKAGDKIVVGQKLAEVSPSYGRKEYGNVEINVWTAGKQILKYCPMNFLDASVRGVYEEKLKRLAQDWEKFVGKDVYAEEKWVRPGCLMGEMVEK